MKNNNNTNIYGGKFFYSEKLEKNKVKKINFINLFGYEVKKINF